MSTVSNNIPGLVVAPKYTIAANGDATNGGHVHPTAESVQFNCINEAGNNNYYMISVTGDAYLNRRGTIYIDSYDFSIIPRQGKTALIDHSPPSTPGNVTITVGSSKSFSESVGFFGTDGTATVSSTGTQSTSTSYSVPDVNILNLSETNSGGNGAIWRFQVSENSNVQSSNLHFDLLALFMIERSQDAQYDPEHDKNGSFTIDVGCTINISDHDGSHGTRWFDTFHADVAGGLPAGSQFVYTNDRIGYISLPPITINLKVPPPAKKA